MKMEQTLSTSKLN
ncbi:unnamed protein product, partial [Rotaria sordida]